ncbi:MAG: UDP-glucose 4-epimerase GalE [Saccharofermentans sp.]|nr:UDP-glucose 4-epimerase GalE [Saccharofermentans sp.]
MKILVTGGTGYIGSHTCVELIKAGHEVVIFDNLYNSKIDVVDKIEQITGVRPVFYNADLKDKESMRVVFEDNKDAMFDTVIHFAGLKAVGESVAKPLMYYKNNIAGTINLTELMNEYGCKSIVFSSSATVYGSPKSVPISEDFPLHTTNPYGSTKLMLEQILSDFCVPDPEWSVVLLRYFNPVGAHESGLIGESPNGIPNNLMPYIMQVAIGKLPQLGVFGNDYPTPDGTGVRDYIHVVDLAKGHVCAVDKATSAKGVNIYNLGTGIGYSVLDIVKAFEAANDVKVPYVIKDRRAGDIAECYANPAKAKTELGWEAQYNLERMCKDSWNFIKTSENVE